MGREKQGELGHLVGQLFREKARQPHLVLEVLRENWRGIVGEKLAGKTHPFKITKGTLWVNTIDSSWAYQLGFMKDDLMKSIRVFLEAEYVKELRFQQGSLEIVSPSNPPASSTQEAATPQSPNPSVDHFVTETAPLSPEQQAPPEATFVEEEIPAQSSPGVAAEPIDTPKLETLQKSIILIKDEITGIEDAKLRDSFSRWRNAHKRRTTKPE